MALKKVKEIKPECCLTCDHLMQCAEVTEAKCRNWKKAEIDKTTVSARYLGILKGMTDLVTELKQVEIEMQIAEKVVGILPKTPEEKPAISKRNKEIVKLVEQGLTIEQIAEELELKPETVRKEIEHLVKIGVLKEVKATNKLSGKKATLMEEGGKVIVLAA